MIFTEDQILAAYADIAARLDLPTRAANLLAVQAAMALAETLITEHPASEPAAMFYAFSRHPRAFPGLTRAMTTIVAAACARSHGIVLGASDADELERMVFLVTEQRIAFDRVLAFFAQRMPQA